MYTVQPELNAEKSTTTLLWQRLNFYCRTQSVNRNFVPSYSIQCFIFSTAIYHFRKKILFYDERIKLYFLREYNIRGGTFYNWLHLFTKSVFYVLKKYVLTKYTKQFI